MKTELTAFYVNKKLRPRQSRYEVTDALSQALRLTVHPTGSKTWVKRFRLPGGRIVKLTLGPYNPGKPASGEPVIGGPLTIAEARQVSAEVNRKRAAGIDVIADRRSRLTSAADSFPVSAREFIETHKVRKTGERPRNWRLVAKVLGLDYPLDGKPPQIVKGSLCDRWATRSMGEISGHDVHAVIAEATKHGTPGLATRTEGPSDNRGRKMADALGSLFKWCMQHRRAAMKAGNPMRDAYRPGPPKARERVLSHDEIRSLWAVSDDLSPPYAGAIRLLLLTGCRLNEIARLEWSEISEDLSLISLPGRRTKNNLAHVVPLAPLARSIIESQKRIENCEFVFSISGGKPISGFQAVKRTLDEKMNTDPWRLHDLRRTCSTQMSELGVVPHHVEAILNHVSGTRAGIAGVYNKAQYVAEKKAGLELWAAFIEGLVTTRYCTGSA
jgi:site-specific recombinase XerD